jgi:hypothetical protein
VRLAYRAAPVWVGASFCTNQAISFPMTWTGPVAKLLKLDIASTCRIVHKWHFRKGCLGLHRSFCVALCTPTLPASSRAALISFVSAVSSRMRHVYAVLERDECYAFSFLHRARKPVSMSALHERGGKAAQSGCELPLLDCDW